MKQTRFFALLLCCSFAAGAAAQTLSDKSTFDKSVTVRGVANVAVKPDAAYLFFFASGDGLSLAEAQRDCDKKLQGIQAAAKKYKFVKSVDVSDVRIGDKNPPGYGDRAANVYQSTKLVALLLSPDFGSVAELLDDAIKAGASLNDSYVAASLGQAYGNLYYVVTDAAKAEAQARQEAVKNAKADATEFAKGFGQSIGEAIYISDETYAPNNLAITLSATVNAYYTQLKYYSTSANGITVNCALRVSFQLKIKKASRHRDALATYPLELMISPASFSSSLQFHLLQF